MTTIFLRRILLLICHTLCFVVVQSAQATPPPQHHLQQAQQSHYMGSHGMAIIALPNDEVLAYHMALYAKPHDYQILYQLALTPEQQAHIQPDTLQTLLPTNFDLMRLINGEKLVISATLYDGHFERGGEKIAHFEQVEFRRRLYQRQLPKTNMSTKISTNMSTDKSANMSQPSTPLAFDVVTLQSGNQLAIHQIAPPSRQSSAKASKVDSRSTPRNFDAIIPLNNAAPANNSMHNLVHCEQPQIMKQANRTGLTQAMIQQLAKACFDRLPLYSEFKDFQ